MKQAPDSSLLKELFHSRRLLASCVIRAESENKRHTTPQETNSFEELSNEVTIPETVFQNEALLHPQNAWC